MYSTRNAGSAETPDSDAQAMAMASPATRTAFDSHAEVKRLKAEMKAKKKAVAEKAASGNE